MIPVEVAARGVAFAAAMLLFGASVFPIYAPMEAFRGGGDWGLDEWLRVRRAVLHIQVIGVAVGILASVVWLMMHAATIGDEPVVRAVSSGTLVTVMRETLFGRVATLRLGLMLLLGVTLMSGRPTRYPETRGTDIARAGLAGIVLATMAWMGHAVATIGLNGRIHLGADIVHLLAAGAWVGGLLPLAFTLVCAADAPAGHITVDTLKRFSRLGMLCVAALLVTGIINAWFLVARSAALFGTAYGQLLLVKLAFFALMVSLAGANRVWLTPQIVTATTHADAARRNAALRRLAKNARTEVALGLAIALIVGALGVMVPAAHTSMPGVTPHQAHEH